MTDGKLTGAIGASDGIRSQDVVTGKAGLKALGRNAQRNAPSSRSR